MRGLYVTRKANISGLLTLDTWRIVGPFPLSTDGHYYSRTRESIALKIDYLPLIGGHEEPLFLKSASTNVPIDFARNARDEVGKAVEGNAFIDQVISFPLGLFASKQVFWGFPRRFGVTYATTSIDIPASENRYLLVSSDSPIKIWLNNHVVADPTPGSTGHNWNDRYILPIHLEAGVNTLLLKVFTFPGRNDFCVRLADESAVTEFLSNNATFIDLLNDLIIPKGGPLSIIDNLQYVSDKHPSGGARIFNQEGRVVKSIAWYKNVPQSIMECPAFFEPVALIETGIQGANDGTTEEAYA